MKVFFKTGTRAFPKGGKDIGCVYVYHQQGAICFTRRYVAVPELPQHLRIKEIQQIALKVWAQLPMRVKHDFKQYARQYQYESLKLRARHIGGYACFLKVMHKMAKFVPEFESCPLSVETALEIISILSVSAMVKMGWLPRVQGFYRWQAQMVKTFITDSDWKEKSYLSSENHVSQCYEPHLLE